MLSSTMRAPQSAAPCSTRPRRLACGLARSSSRHSAGRRVDGGDARIDAADKTVLHASLKPLAPGTYSVQWRVVSVDSHATESSFDFRVAG